MKVVRGGRTVASTGASLRGDKVRRGAFSLPVPVKSLPRGARVRVTLSLVDEAAGFASVRKTLRARSAAAGPQPTRRPSPSARC